ncbi:MAG TPA: hypothetical protein VGO93_26390 [Candidatus Xenobia bacterium]|jgi:hypothetical protein
MQSTIRADYPLSHLPRIRTRTVTSNYAVSDADGVVYVNASGGSVTITLPPAANRAAKSFTIVRTDSSANTVTISPLLSGDTINGSASLALSGAYSNTAVQSNGVSTWVAAMGASSGSSTVGALVTGGQKNGNASATPIGTPVYQTSTSGQFDMAKTDSFSTSRVVALVYDTSIASSATGNVQTGGVFTFASTAQVDAVCGTSGGFGTPGQVFFLSDATAGALTSTAPSTAGHFLVPVLQAITSTTAYMLLPAQIVGL